MNMIVCFIICVDLSLFKNMYLQFTKRLVFIIPFSSATIHCEVAAGDKNYANIIFTSLPEKD